MNKCLLRFALLVMVNVAVVNAHAADVQTAAQAEAIAKAKNDDKVFWPMLKGESLDQLATKLYPDSPILKKRFINKTLSLSREVAPNLQVKKPFKSAQMLIIPNEHAVRELTHKIKRFKEVANTVAEKEKLKLSYTLGSAPAYVPVVPAPAKTAPVEAVVAEPEPAIVAAPKVTDPAATAADELSVDAKPMEVKPVEIQPAPTPIPAVVVKESPTKKEVQPPVAPASKVNNNDSVLPDLHIPDITLPEITLPEVNLNAAKQWVSQYWDGVVAGFHKLSKDVGSYLVNANKSIRERINAYEGKGIQDVLSDYRLRNGILLGLLGLIALGLLIFTKRHSKKAVGGLDDISDTIRKEKPEKQASSVVDSPVVDGIDSFKDMLKKQQAAEPEFTIEIPHEPPKNF